MAHKTYYDGEGVDTAFSESFASTVAINPPISKEEEDVVSRSLNKFLSPTNRLNCPVKGMVQSNRQEWIGVCKGHPNRRRP